MRHKLPDVQVHTEVQLAIYQKSHQRPFEIFVSNVSLLPKPKGFDHSIISPHSLPKVRNRGRDSNSTVNSAEKPKRRRYGSTYDSARIEFHPIAMELRRTVGSHFDRALHHLISLIAGRRGISPACERLNLWTRFAARSLQLSAIATVSLKISNY